MSHRAALARYTGNRTGKLKVGRCVLSEKSMPRSGSFSRHILRLREIERVIESRHGMGVPETDDGDLYIEAAAFALNAHSRARGKDLDHLLHGWCSRWAPWALARAGSVLRPILNKLVRRVHDLKADDVAKLIQVTYSERQMIGLCTIGACDVPRHVRRAMAKARKREIDRQRQAEIRRRQGRQPRQSFLAGNRISHLKPWIALNISRRTWYRRSGTGPSKLDRMVIGDTPVPSASAFTRGAAHAAPLVGAAELAGSAFARHNVDGAGAHVDANPPPSRAPNDAVSAKDHTGQYDVEQELRLRGGASG